MDASTSDLMMTGGETLYFDAASGASGDMVVGALLDLGVPFAALEAGLAVLPLEGFRIAHRKESRGGIAGSRFGVEVDEGRQPERHWNDFERLIGGSALSDAVKERSLRMFERLCRVEGEIHGVPHTDVHLHEVGGADSIVDIVGAAIGFDLLESQGIREIVCSAINVGSGTVATAHGILPVPAPATAALLVGTASYGSEVPLELCTPTGALLLTEYASRFAAQPAMRVTAIGYGLGSREIAGRPNALRVSRGELSGTTATKGLPSMTVVETNIDDMPGEWYGYLMERLLAAGAADVFFTPVQMKKNRPGVLVRALAGRERIDELARILFRETTTLGCRIYEVDRLELERQTLEVETPYGRIAVKRGLFKGEETNAAPEFEACAAAARAFDVPVKEVDRAAREAYERARRMI